MTNFDSAFNKVINIYEGGYVTDPDDSGGETYRGISRNANPEWEGWKIIDSLKNLPHFPKSLEFNQELKYLVQKVYKKKYWDPFRGDKLNQDVAEELFDQAVNFNTDTAIKNFQRTLNILNKSQKLYLDIKVDGVYGNITHDTYLTASLKRGNRIIFNVLNFYQGKKYIELMEANDIKEKYLGWFGRVTILKG